MKRLPHRRTHGMFGTPTYNSWGHMIQRCENPKSPRWLHYGGRGIKVHPAWHSFEQFLADMGTKPAKGWSIERKNNDGDYCPGNCVWLPMPRQARNRQNTRYVSIGGDQKPLSEWCELLNISPETFRSRVRLGWSEVLALTTPIDEHKRNHRGEEQVRG